MVFFFSSSRRQTSLTCDWSSDVCSSDLHLWLFYDDRGLAEAGEGRSAVFAGTLDGEIRELALLTAVISLCDVRHCRRSEERRVGKERRSRWPPHLYNKQHDWKLFDLGNA